MSESSSSQPIGDAPKPADFSAETALYEGTMWDDPITGPHVVAFADWMDGDLAKLVAQWSHMASPRDRDRPLESFPGTATKRSR